MADKMIKSDSIASRHVVRHDHANAIHASLDLHCWGDEQLVAAAQQGHCSAMDELLSRYRGIVYGTMRRYSDSREEADDLVQETMLRAFQNIGKFRGQARFSSWLVAIAIHAAISAKRKARRAHWVYLDEPLDTDEKKTSWVLVDGRATPEQAYIQQEHHVLLKRKIKKMKPKYRTMVQWMDLDGVSIHAAALSLGITNGAAKSRLHRARRMLTDAFQPYMSGRSLTDITQPVDSGQQQEGVE